MSRPTVLYVSGMTRCGSTMLGNVLNEIPGVVHIGELHYLWRNGILRKGTNSSCGCGDDVDACPTWAPVLASPDVPTSAGQARTVVESQRSALNTRSAPRRVADARAGRGVAPAARAAVRAMTATYRVLDEQLGSPLIVDSSKYPAEAAALHASGEVDLKVLHMVRDPRATAYSYHRSKAYIAPMSPARVTAHWLGINLASDLLRALGDGRYLRVRHEEFGRDPRGVIDRVRAFAGIDGANPVDDGGRVELGTNHTVTGNPDRLRQGMVDIRCDDRWTTELAPSARAVVSAGAALPMSRYGYSLASAGRS